MIRSVAYCLSLAYIPVAVHAHADTVQFFDASQIATLVAEAVTSDTIVSGGYQFTYTRDKLFTGGTGQVIGRSVRVPWPDGVEAQAVTTAPPNGTTEKARIVLERADGQTFRPPGVYRQTACEYIGRRRRHRDHAASERRGRFQ